MFHRPILESFVATSVVKFKMLMMVINLKYQEIKADKNDNIELDYTCGYKWY